MRLPQLAAVLAEKLLWACPSAYRCGPGCAGLRFAPVLRTGSFIATLPIPHALQPPNYCYNAELPIFAAGFVVTITT
jgi:hypothetical protein